MVSFCWHWSIFLISAGFQDTILETFDLFACHTCKSMSCYICFMKVKSVETRENMSSYTWLRYCFLTTMIFLGTNCAVQCFISNNSHNIINEIRRYTFISLFNFILPIILFNFILPIILFIKFIYFMVITLYDAYFSIFT